MLHIHKGISYRPVATGTWLMDETSRKAADGSYPYTLAQCGVYEPAEVRLPNFLTRRGREQLYTLAREDLLWLAETMQRGEELPARQGLCFGPDTVATTLDEHRCRVVAVDRPAAGGYRAIPSEGIDAVISTYPDEPELTFTIVGDGDWWKCNNLYGNLKPMAPAWPNYRALLDTTFDGGLRSWTVADAIIYQSPTFVEIADGPKVDGSLLEGVPKGIMMWNGRMALFDGGKRKQMVALA